MYSRQDEPPTAQWFAKAEAIDIIELTKTERNI
jgi:hypothetical protein